MERPVRTHTLYMSYKKYKKWSKTGHQSIDKYPTRTHIIF